MNIKLVEHPYFHFIFKAFGHFKISINSIYYLYNKINGDNKEFIQRFSSVREVTPVYTDSTLSEETMNRNMPWPLASGHGRDLQSDTVRGRRQKLVLSQGDYAVWMRHPHFETEKL